MEFGVMFEGSVVVDEMGIRGFVFYWLWFFFGVFLDKYILVDI